MALAMGVTLPSSLCRCKEEGGGGLRTITFADGQAHDIEDLNPNNLTQKWNSIRWGGGTWIMPGFRLLLKTYTDEFVLGAKMMK